MTLRFLSTLAQPRSLLAAAALAAASLVHAQSAVSPFHEVRAEAAAQDGVPLSALSPTAPDSYTVKRGDTLWAISGMFLKSPWRWPELWGMNKSQIRNPHLIYPGQVLYLDKSSGRARLRMGQAVDGRNSGAVRLSPQTRISSLKDDSILPIPNHMIAPFLAEMIVVDANEFAQAPRFVAGTETRTLMVQGDRAYVRASRAGDLSMAPGAALSHRIYRNAEPLKDPETGEVLAYEAKFLGRAQLVRPAGTAMKDGELIQAVEEGSPVLPLYNENRPFNGELPDSAENTAINPVTQYPYNTVVGEGLRFGESAWRDDWRSTYKGTFDNRINDEQSAHVMPATVDILLSREEIRVGDRLGPDMDANALASYVPQPAPNNMRARIVSVYSGEVYAGQNQIVAINKGVADGLTRGSILSVLTKGDLVRDRTDASRPLLRLPNEINGNMMVFSVFDKVSYALLLGVTTPVRIGDYAIDPQSLENEMQED